MPIDKAIKVCSFDIFDTVLTRAVARPQDIFYLMQHTLKEPQYEALSSQIVEYFPRIRVRSELMCRFKALSRGCEEITLQEIYAQLAHKYALTNLQIEQLMKLEMKTEQQSIVGVRQTIDLINHCRDEGKKIIFISDMYLPLYFIQDLLVFLGVFKPSFDQIYLSNQQRLTKASGGLFKFMLQDLSICPYEVKHFGDDYHSDLSVPKELGINVHELSLPTLKISKVNGLAHKITRLIELLNV